MQFKTIITGVTGMVGEGVLHECLQHPDVEQVLVINRKPCGVSHPKLKEILHSDFFNLLPIKEQLKGYDACFFCLGVSSVGMKEPEYYKLTYELTMHMATILAGQNPDMIFNYVSGAGTDSTETSKSMWARVKGKTENHLLQLPFKKAYMFRPGYIHPTKGLKNAHKLLGIITWMYPLLKIVLPKHVCTLQQLGLAMIHTVTKGYNNQIIHSEDIIELAAE